MAVIFDLDEPLMPEHPAALAAIEATAGALSGGATVQPREFRRVPLDPAREHGKEMLLALLGASADSAVLVGDRPATDIAGANAAGIRSIRIRRPDNQHPMDGDNIPDAIITSLEELSKHLR